MYGALPDVLVRLLTGRLGYQLGTTRYGVSRTSPGLLGSCACDGRESVTMGGAVTTDQGVPGQ